MPSSVPQTKPRRTPCKTSTKCKTCPFFERSSKRRKGYPSETHMKRGLRVVHGDKWLEERLGRKDPCPCGSGRSFQEVLPEDRPLRWRAAGHLFSASESSVAPHGSSAGFQACVPQVSDLHGWWLTPSLPRSAQSAAGAGSCASPPWPATRPRPAGQTTGARVAPRCAGPRSRACA